MNAATRTCLICGGIEECYVGNCWICQNPQCGRKHKAAEAKEKADLWVILQIDDSFNYYSRTRRCVVIIDNETSPHTWAVSTDDGRWPRCQICNHILVERDICTKSGGRFTHHDCKETK